MLDNEDIKKLIEAQEPVFATKKDLQDIRDDILEFKNEILEGQDEILEKLEDFSPEKTMGEEQDKRNKRAFEIHNNALKRSKILSAEEIVEIDKLHVIN